MSRSSDLSRFLFIARLSSIKNTAIWPRSFLARAFSRSSSSMTLSLVRKRIESPKNPVTVQNSQPYGQPRPVSIGTTKNLPQPSPNLDIIGCRNFGTRLELFEIERFPRDVRIWLKARLFVVSFFVDLRLVDFFQRRRSPRLRRSAASIHRLRPEQRRPRGAARRRLPRASSGHSVTCGPPITTLKPGLTQRVGNHISRATIRVIDPMPTRPIFSSLQNCTSSGRVIALALPSIRTTSCSFGVSDWSRNIHKCGIKFRVIPLSGLYNKIFIFRKE